MLLAIDIGNTEVSLGLFYHNELKAHWRLSSGITRTEDESWILIKMFSDNAGIDVKKITGVAISSVVPDLTPVYETLSQERLQCPQVVVSADLDLGLKILYDDPNSVGADRLCDAVAGFAKYGGPLLIIDFGTATTFNVISESGDYLGGVIAPGVASSANTLYRYAARLPKIELRFPERLIGTTTETSLQAGVMYGSVEMARGLIGGIEKELGAKPKILCTGGLAKPMMSRLGPEVIHEPFLTLEGLRQIFEREVRGTKRVRPPH
jgi:type III pantothenate kinase